MENPKEKQSKFSTHNSGKNAFIRFYALAFELVILNLILIGGGYFLDRYLATTPIFVLIGVFLGMFGTIILLLKFSK